MQTATKNPHLSVDSVPLSVDGDQVGWALSLGRRHLFFTTAPDLLSLDGVSFQTLNQIRESVRRLRPTKPHLHSLA